MIVVPIVPPKELHLVQHEPHFVFAELVLEDEAYVRSITQLQGTRYMDTLVYERGNQIPIDDYFKAMRLVQPHFGFVPDVPFDLDATLRRHEEFMKDWSYGNPIGVLQGTTIDEVITCAKAMLRTSSYLAVPVRLPDRVGIPRSEIVQRVRLTTVRPIRFHYLGARYPYDDEALTARKIPDVRSIDTAEPYNLARAGYNYYNMQDELALKRAEGFMEAKPYPWAQTDFPINLFWLKALLATPKA